jgi:hypothetical protein
LRNDTAERFSIDGQGKGPFPCTPSQKQNLAVYTKIWTHPSPKVKCRLREDVGRHLLLPKKTPIFPVTSLLFLIGYRPVIVGLRVFARWSILEPEFTILTSRTHVRITRDGTHAAVLSLFPFLDKCALAYRK